MFDKLIDWGFAVVTYCQEDKTSFWNFALVNEIPTEKQLSKIEETMKSLNRQPEVYFENRKYPKPEAFSLASFTSQ